MIANPDQVTYEQFRTEISRDIQVFMLSWQHCESDNPISSSSYLKEKQRRKKYEVSYVFNRSTTSLLVDKFSPLLLNPAIHRQRYMTLLYLWLNKSNGSIPWIGLNVYWSCLPEIVMERNAYTLTASSSLAFLKFRPSHRHRVCIGLSKGTCRGQFIFFYILSSILICAV